MILATSQMFFIMLALPTLLGLIMVGEGMYKVTHYMPGWTGIFFGSLFLMVVAFGYFFLRGYL